jgi:hypothetical protein
VGAPLWSSSTRGVSNEGYCDRARRQFPGYEVAAVAAASSLPVLQPTIPSSFSARLLVHLSEEDRQ